MKVGDRVRLSKEFRDIHLPIYHKEWEELGPGSHGNAKSKEEITARMERVGTVISIRAYLDEDELEGEVFKATRVEVSVDWDGADPKERDYGTAFENLELV